MDQEQSPEPTIPEPTAETTTETPGASTEHLERIAVEPEPGAGDGEGEGPQPHWDGFIPLEAFTEGFGVAFAMLGELTGLDTLRAVPKNPTTAPAAKAIYDTCREVPWLHWLVRPESRWMQRGMMVGAFAIPLAVACKMELKAKRAKPVNEPAAGAGAAPPREPPPPDGAPLS